ncbi:MAG: GNAT family N-acetyltransferase, partial [Candidatus Poribacteria bacterium]|nr:GNAT family N-acetyltransferase [Candidatus Poribacteria bacterium]
MDQKMCRQFTRNFINISKQVYFHKGGPSEIRSKEDDPFIGTITLDTHHNGIDTEVSYQILPEWWGLGYATETLRTVMAY